ncbi:MAG: arginine--tRNA ligase [Candidatus Omnitrophica bacterium]|nr:arginine--tRNA ligase [Candidatus Omnitrophota bacterium]
MLDNIRTQIQSVIKESLKATFPSLENFPESNLEIPVDKTHGDFCSSVALKSAKILKKSPMEIAQQIVVSIKSILQASPLKDKIYKVEVKAPGFINVFLSQKGFYEILSTILEKKGLYGESTLGEKKKVLIEFVSANPTGSLSVAHARQAAVGDALGNILKFLGFDVDKEYYVNDGGNQINILGWSVYLRAEEILGEKIEFPDDYYQGEYIKDMARIFMEAKGIQSVDALKEFKGKPKELSQWACNYLLDVIKTELSDFGVFFDNWLYESKVATHDKIETVLETLREKGLVYDQDNAEWFKSTNFGDDKDRVVKKSDGSYTYLAPDIVYHQNKFDRGYDWLINIWGPDHHGYIPRIKAAVQALGKSKDSLDVLIIQLATIYRNGEVLSMSTRRGQYISLREVMDEIGVDAARFFFLMRHIEGHLEFDLEVAKKETPENPVYYIQYAHARIHSINKKAAEQNLGMTLEDFHLLKEQEELDLIRKLGEFPDALKFCHEQLDPYPLLSYLLDLANIFHRFYDKHKVVGEDKDLSCERLTLVNCAKIVFANGLKLLGVATPEKM